MSDVFVFEKVREYSWSRGIFVMTNKTVLGGGERPLGCALLHKDSTTFNFSSYKRMKGNMNLQNELLVEENHREI